MAEINYKKRHGDRKDARWLRELDSLHGIMPYLYPNRADNEAYIMERIDLTNINEYMEKKNAQNPEVPYKLFQIIITAFIKTVTLRPKMNRFIQGGRLYQRDALTAAFVVKKEFADEGAEALAYVEFDENSTLDSVHKKVYDIVHSCRQDAPDDTTAAMDMLMKLPRPILRFVMWCLRKLDYYGKVPDSLIGQDPNYSSVFITNLGSIGLKSGYHHLSNWGTSSIFVVLGEKKIVDGREIIDIGLTLDERIADGYYYSKTVKLLKHLLQNPELLELPAKEEVDYDRK